MKKLSTTDKYALNVLEKHGELMRYESGFKHFTFGTVTATARLTERQVNKMVAIGACRIDQVGQSVFAVFIRRP